MGSGDGAVLGVEVQLIINTLINKEHTSGRQPQYPINLYPHTHVISPCEGLLLIITAKTQFNRKLL